MEKTNAPFNLEAEQSVLGAVILDKEMIGQVVQLMKPEDFYVKAHEEIFDVILYLNDSGIPVDFVSISEELKKRNLLGQVGGNEYLMELANTVPTSANASYYATIVREKSILRNLIHAAAEISKMAYDDSEDMNEILDKSEQAVFEIVQNRVLKDYRHIGDIMDQTLMKLDERNRQKGRVTGIPSDFIDLDRITSGFQPSDLILLAARPAMGKTSLGLNFITNAAKRGYSAGIFSLEMAAEQLVQRMLCSEARVDAQRLRNGELEEEDWERISLVIEDLTKAPIYIDDTAGINLMELKSKARRMKLEKDIKIILIDYLQLIQTSQKIENRQQEISKISRELKSLARELNIPIIAISQLSRAPDQRPDHKPRLSDLRESGSQEQDSDIVMFVYREEYYDPDTERKNSCDLIIAKHRNGSTGEVELAWLGQYTKFANLETRE